MLCTEEQCLMTTEIKMPQLGESITEGTVSRWLKQPGEQVEKYEPLLEVTTDKVDSEIPAPVAGTLLEIVVGAGTTVAVGTVIARVGSPEASAAEPVAPAPNETSVAANGDARRAPPVSPLVARMAAEHGLDLNAIRGTGVGGRVSKQDVLRYLEARANPAQTVQTATKTDEPEQPVQTPPREPVAAQTLGEDSWLQPLTAMRRLIAEHMQHSLRTAPHVTSVIEVDLTRVVAHRKAQQASVAQQGLRLTFTPYFVQAVCVGLRAVPVINGRYSDQGIVFNRRIHVGVAVALPDGLIVPVIRDADEKNLAGLARAVNDVAERARKGKLNPGETQGGTFTISNYGTGGSLIGTPIINQPQSAILGCGAIVKRPVVVTHHGEDTIAIRAMCYLSLSFDHRLIDGATADQFLSVVKQQLEQYPA
jgi:2-oxoisovalerate dehydrogenase E2 component (dihydrolipoyl transacylase)